MNKRGIADIIVTIVIVGLALAALVVVGIVINGIVNTGSKNIDLQATCSGITVDVLSMNCSLGVPTTPQNCSVALERTGTDQSVISGVKLVFKNATSTSPVIDVPGDVQKLVGKNLNINTTISNTNSVGVTVYITDNTNTQQLCQQTSTFP